MIEYIKLRTYIKQWIGDNKILRTLAGFVQGIVYVFDYLYYFVLPGHRNRFVIREVNVEFASQCNLRCKFCSLDHTKPKVLITEEILEKFLKNFIEDKRFQKIEIINLHNGGEVLLHPKRLEMLGVIKKYKDLAKQKGLKFPKIWLLTNGMLLREKVAQEILDLNVIDCIGLSMDGGTPEAFEYMRENAKWPIFYKNLKAVCKLIKDGGHNVETYSICCIPEDKDLSTNWMNPEFRDALETLDRYELRRLHNWRGELEEEANKDIKVRENLLKIGCSLMMSQMVLLPNGDVTVCCNDLNSVGVVGNIRKDDFIDIYRNNERSKYLKYLLFGKKKQLELCKDCPTF